MLYDLLRLKALLKRLAYFCIGFLVGLFVYSISSL